jgi:hypothetical protein
MHCIQHRPLHRWIHFDEKMKEEFFFFFFFFASSDKSNRASELPVLSDWLTGKLRLSIQGALSNVSDFSFFFFFLLFFFASSDKSNSASELYSIYWSQTLFVQVLTQDWCK